MLISVVPPAVPVSDAAEPGVVAPGLGTTICVPSASGAARFNDVRSAPLLAPPARFTASITRSPDHELVDTGTPHPSGDVDDDRRGDSATATPVRPATGDTTGETASAGAAMSTGRGSERMYQNPAPSNDATTTIASPASSPRESESSRSRRDMRGTLPVRAAPFRDAQSHGERRQRAVTKFTSLGARTISLTIVRSPIARRADR